MLKSSRSLRLWALLSLFLSSSACAVDLSKYHGDVVYLDFWASWCDPCVKSFPWMQAMQDKYAKQGLKVVAVSLDDSKADVDQFLAKNPVSFDIEHDPEGKLAAEYGLIGMPTSFILGRDGKQLSRHVSFRVDFAKDYEDALLEALAQP